MFDRGGGKGLSMSGFQFKMQEKIIHKFQKVGATSIEKAVTFMLLHDYSQLLRLPFDSCARQSLQNSF